MHFAGGGFDGGARGGQRVVRTVHAPLGGRLLVLLDSHVGLLEGVGEDSRASSAETRRGNHALPGPSGPPWRKAKHYSPSLPPAADRCSRPTLELGQAGERVRALTARALPLLSLRADAIGQGLRASLVHGHQGQRQDELVLDDLDQAGPRLQREQVFLAVVVLRLRRGLVGHEAEPAVHLDGGLHGAQAALAGQGHAGLGAQVQPGLRRAAGRPGAHLALGAPSHTLLGVSGRMQIAREAPEIRERRITIESGARLGEAQRVQALRIENGRGGLAGHRGILGRP